MIQQDPTAPPHLRDFLADKAELGQINIGLTTIPSEQLYQFAAKCIQANHAYFNHVFKECCNICDKKLTDEDKSLSKTTDFSMVCKEHRSSSQVYQIDIEREKLGFNRRVFI